MLNPSEPAERSSISPHQPLPDGLALRTVASLEELERVAEFNGLIHEPGVAGLTYNLFASHPDTSGRDLAFIENEQGEVLASLCLIPWTIRYGTVDLPVGELGIVGTHADYRKRGLNRTLMQYFWQRFNERGCLFSIIQGIPYFYRQFGYEYSHLPLEGGWRLQPDQVPPPLVEGYSFRSARMDDLPALTRLYEAQAARQDLSARRSEALWCYLLGEARRSDAMQHDTWLIFAPDGELAGYLRLPHFHFNENLLTIDEVSELSFEAGLAVLNELKRLALLRRKDGIRFNLPLNAGLLRLGRAYGASKIWEYSWQIAAPDMPALLQRLAPLFEARLAGSMFAGLSRTLSLDTYQQVIELEFAAGRLLKVRSGGPGQNALLAIPAAQLIPLVLGGSTLDEIKAIFPDAAYRDPWQLLVETLFPRTQAFFQTIY